MLDKRVRRGADVASHHLVKETLQIKLKVF